jgi:predicted neuraminidase
MNLTTRLNKSSKGLVLVIWAILFFMSQMGLQAQEVNGPFFEKELLFPVEHWHNHSSSIVELPNGDLLVAWFHGSGEKNADDTVILGARWSKQIKVWSKPFLLADTPFFPDTNCVLYIDSQERLWLFWPTILANEWHTALMNYRLSTDYQQPDGPPAWDWSDNIFLIPKNMASRTIEVIGPDVDSEESVDGGRSYGGGSARELKVRARRLITRAQDKYFSRVGWFTRNHPIEIPSGRMIVPMYSDGYSFGIMALSDDRGKTWFSSEPIVGYGGIQPSVVRRGDGELVAYMRDNGPAPKRMQISYSRDDGVSWTAAADTELPNPGSSCEVIRLKDSSWVLVYNDTESGRSSLAIALSEDEGHSWKYIRHLERYEAISEERKPSFSYPSVIQARDGSIHVTYSYFTSGSPREKTIRHVRLNSEWIKADKD